MMHTLFTNVQHLHFNPVAEHKITRVVIHSAHIELSLFRCDSQVCFSATGHLENTHRKIIIGTNSYGKKVVIISARSRAFFST